MQPRYPIWLRGILVILVPVLLILLTYVNYQFALQSRIGNEFLVGWSSAKSWVEQGISPYDPAMRNNIQQSLYGRPADPEAGEFLGLFTSLHPALLFYLPFSLLPFEIAQSVWMTVTEIGLLLLVIIGTRLLRWNPNRLLLAGLFLFSLFWYHGARVIVTGSLSFLIAVLICGAVLAIRHGIDWVAGLMLALGLVQPNLSVLLVVFVLVWGLSSHRWQLILSILGFFLLMVTASTILSPTWPFEWVGQSIDLLKSTSISSAPIILSSQFPRINSGVRIAISILLGIYLLWEWIQAWGKDKDWFTWTASMTVAISMLLVPQLSTDGMVLLLPILVMIFGHWIGRWGGGGQTMAWLTLLFLGVSLWWLSLQGSATPGEHPLLFLLIPIVAFLGLLWVRWWVTSRQRGFLRSSMQ